MDKKTIAVIGATGSQGGSVVNELAKTGQFHIRAISRDPGKYQGPADEAVKGDLQDPASLKKAFEGADGVFVVTNFWEGADELQQGKNAVQAAKEAGVKHYIWSTLPNVEKISGGRYNVPHFTRKAEVDQYVKDAGFQHHSFVEAPFYFQNLATVMAPRPLENGKKGWTMPIDPSKRVIHMGDVNDLGKVVAGAFLHPEQTGKGRYLAMAPELKSFNDVLSTYRSRGYDYTFQQVKPEEFASSFEGAGELAEMLGYFEEYTYMGPDSEPHIRAAEEVATGEYNSLQSWIDNS